MEHSIPEERFYESSRAVNNGWRFTARIKYHVAGLLSELQMVYESFPIKSYDSKSSKDFTKHVTLQAKSAFRIIFSAFVLILQLGRLYESSHAVNNGWRFTARIKLGISTEK